MWSPHNDNLTKRKLAATNYAENAAGRTAHRHPFGSLNGLPM